MRALSPVGIAAAALALALPASARAQAVCSAPHSSPVISKSGAVEPLPVRTGWAQLTLYRQRTGEFFDPTGAERPFLADGEATTSSLFLTAATGIVGGVELWGQLPLHHLVYEDQGGRRERTGLGDPRMSVRVGPEVVGVHGWPVSLRAGVKLPGSEFPVDATILPLTEGQRDWELSLEVGRTFRRWPVYALGWIGYRWREENEAAARDPGDERFGHLGVGGTAAVIDWELALEGIWGSAPRHVGVELATARRRMLQLQPGVGWRLGPGRLDFGALVPLAGRN
ncbi:MAG: hypothetical protein HY561_01535, partial [Gemmatimonadetes bacterium]|nr:hypothetical protein [Gemmatimonadota bacterium]